MDKWTKCYEKMPEDRQLVLVQYSDGCINISKFYKGVFFDFSQLWELDCQDEIYEWKPFDISDDGWISMNDKKPEDGDVIAVRANNGRVYVLCAYEDSLNGFNFLDSDGCYVCGPEDVEGWKPITTA